MIVSFYHLFVFLPIYLKTVIVIRNFKRTNDQQDKIYKYTNMTEIFG